MIEDGSPAAGVSSSSLSEPLKLKDSSLSAIIKSDTI